MSKYTKSFKLQIVKDYETLRLGYKTIGDKYGVIPSTVRKWIYGYQVHGQSYFDKHSQSYTADFKLKVLKHMQDNELSLMRTTALFKIPAVSTVLQWQRLYDVGGESALLSSKLGRSVMSQTKGKVDKAPKDMTQEELLEEVLNLRAERDYLKKLEALIQQKKLAEKHKLR
jgi:transposase-like protein